MHPVSREQCRSSECWALWFQGSWTLSGLPMGHGRPSRPAVFWFFFSNSPLLLGAWRAGPTHPIPALAQAISFFFFFNSYFIYLFIYLFIFSCVGSLFRARAFSSCGKRGPLFIGVQGPLFITVRGPLTIAVPPVAGHRLQTCRLSSCGSRAQLLRGMWDLPRPGLEPVSPALAGRFSTTAPPGKPPGQQFCLCFFPGVFLCSHCLFRGRCRAELGNLRHVLSLRDLRLPICERGSSARLTADARAIPKELPCVPVSGGPCEVPSDLS